MLDGTSGSSARAPALETSTRIEDHGELELVRHESFSVLAWTETECLALPLGGLAQGSGFDWIENCVNSIRPFLAVPVPALKDLQAS